MSDVTKLLRDLRDLRAHWDADDSAMTFDLFRDADWRRKISPSAADGMVTVTLSTGKTVTVNSQFLGLLRILAEELAEDDPLLN